MPERVETFPDLELADHSYSQALLDAAKVVQALALRSHGVRFESQPQRSPVVDLALSASVLALNAMLAAAGARCRCDRPPADVDMLTDADGRLIYRCRHASPHEWTLDGVQS